MENLEHEKQSLEIERSEIASALISVRAKLPHWDNPLDSLAEKVLASDTTEDFSLAELHRMTDEYRARLTNFRLRFPDAALHADTRHPLAPFLRALLHVIAEDAVELVHAAASVVTEAEAIAGDLAKEEEEISALQQEADDEDRAEELLTSVVVGMVKEEAENSHRFAQDLNAYAEEIVEKALQGELPTAVSAQKKRRGFFATIKNALFQY